MRKIFILLLTLISTTACADKIYYSNYISQKQKVDSVWTDWTDWEESYTPIVFDHMSGYITVGDCSYKVLDTGKCEDDNSTTVIYLTYDANKKRVNMRLRYQNDGVKQLYIDYENIVYCYNLM